MQTLKPTYTLSDVGVFEIVLRQVGREEIQGDATSQPITIRVVGRRMEVLADNVFADQKGIASSVGNSTEFYWIPSASALEYTVVR